MAGRRREQPRCFDIARAPAIPDESDVFPTEPAVLAVAMLRLNPERWGSSPPRLLYEDGSLQHAGLYFHFDRLGWTWNNEHYYKGLHGSLPAAQVRREVPAVTAACG